MTDLAQIALEFCRECLGWEDVYTSEVQHPDEQVYSPSRVIMSGKNTNEFHYTDLDAVMAGVRGWCHATKYRNRRYLRFLGFALHYGSQKKKYTASIKAGVRLAIYSSANPCHALLAACVEASRKMKGVA